MFSKLVFHSWNGLIYRHRTKPNINYLNVNDTNSPKKFENSWSNALLNCLFDQEELNARFDTIQIKIWKTLLMVLEMAEKRSKYLVKSTTFQGLNETFQLTFESLKLTLTRIAKTLTDPSWMFLNLLDYLGWYNFEMAPNWIKIWAKLVGLEV